MMIKAAHCDPQVVFWPGADTSDVELQREIPKACESLGVKSAILLDAATHLQDVAYGRWHPEAIAS